VLVAAEDVVGFFDATGEPEPWVTFVGVHEYDEGRPEAEDTWLDVVNRRQEKIGEYFVGRAVRGAHAPGGKTLSYRMTAAGGENPGAGEIWRTVAAGVAAGAWAASPPEAQETWLHVVQNSWFATGHAARRYGTGDAVRVDGPAPTTVPGLYLALGEAANGPGGYLGSNLDALADCLASTPEAHRFRRLVWPGAGFPDSVRALLAEFGIEVTAA
jgi:hypothetical protein